MDEVRAWEAEAVEVGQAALWMEPGSRGSVRVQVIEELMGGNLYMIETAEGAQVVVPWQQLGMIQDQQSQQDAGGPGGGR